MDPIVVSGLAFLIYYTYRISPQRELIGLFQIETLPGQIGCPDRSLWERPLPFHRGVELLALWFLLQGQLMKRVVARKLPLPPTLGPLGSEY